MRPSHRRLPGAAAASNCIHFEGLHIPDQNASASPASVGDDDSAGDEASEQAAAQQEISDVDSAQDFIAMFE